MTDEASIIDEMDIEAWDVYASFIDDFGRMFAEKFYDKSDLGKFHEVHTVFAACSYHAEQVAMQLEYVKSHYPTDDPDDEDARGEKRELAWNLEAEGDEVLYRVRVVPVHAAYAKRVEELRAVKGTLGMLDYDDVIHELATAEVQAYINAIRSAPSAS